MRPACAVWVSLGFPGGINGKEPACQSQRHVMQVLSMGGEDPLEKDIATPPVFLPGESHGQRGLVSYSH